MNLLDIVRRSEPPAPWAEGEKIPWSEPAFSARMLREHLSQEHDAASRRAAVIDRQVAWIHGALLGGKPTRVLDLACGPGLYCSRLARLGHSCEGIDYAPASVAYARDQAERDGLDARYRQEDIRHAEYGAGFGLVMLLYGEFNVFRPSEARAILRGAHAALAEGGRLLLEPHTVAGVRAIVGAPSWYSSPSGLFSEQPHLCLEESAWDEAQQVAVVRYYVVDAASGSVQRHASSTQAYTDDGYRDLLRQCGFDEVILEESLEGPGAEVHSGLMVIHGLKGG
ncbi:MAG: class I SAM-dependent methyltransferase [Chloroflexi bacterium]|nr:class I SAM-dependent methyltransferase [Chloroflexota bacterium]